MMKLTRLEKWYLGGLLAVFGSVVLHAPLSVGLGVLFPEYGLFIKAWKEIILLALIPVAFRLIERRHLWMWLKGDWIMRGIALYATLHVILALWFPHSLAVTAAGLAIDLRYVLFFALAYIAAVAIPMFRRQMIIVGMVGACIVVGFATTQLFLPPDILVHIGYSKNTIMPYLTVDKNPDYIRVNSTLRGPNPLGAYAGMVLGLVAAAMVRARFSFRDKRLLPLAVILGLCGTVALWISYSRSALVAGIVTVSIVLVVALFRKVSVRVWVGIGTALIAIAGGLVAVWESPVIANVLFHENPADSNSVNSNEEHFASLEYGVAQLVREPLGSGVGSTGSASLFGDAPVIVENQYLFIAHESGWVGLALFIGVFAMVLIRLWYRRQDWLSLGVFASGIGLALIGLLLPVWVDDTVAIVWWGLAAIAISRREDDRKQTK